MTANETALILKKRELLLFPMQSYRYYFKILLFNLIFTSHPENILKNIMITV